MIDADFQLNNDIMPFCKLSIGIWKKSEFGCLHEFSIISMIFIIKKKGR